MTGAVDLIRRFRHLRALVIGDVMLDTYLEGSATRICSEGPVPVVRKTGERRLPGGAANTAANLRALGADVVLLGITGRDITASLLRSTLREAGVDDRWLIEDAGATTHHKLRILADGQYVVRFDEGTQQYTAKSYRRLLTCLEAAYGVRSGSAPACDLVVVSDYCYGVTSREVIVRLQQLQAERPRVLLIDSKGLQHFRDVEATVVTPNHLEARLLTEYAPEERALQQDAGQTPAEIEQLGQHLRALLKSEYVAITMAEDGVLLVDQQGKTRHLPARPVTRASDVGAGDSFAAALALALAAGAPMEEAARIGIEAATIAVARRWTTTVQQQELLQRVSLQEHIAHAHTSGAEARARLLRKLEAERRAGRTIVFTNGVFDILHAGHVQFLRQARALGDLLVVGVNSDRSARLLRGRNQPLNSEQDRLALVAALDPVDHALLFDEETPTELIRALRPHIHAKGGDYVDEALPEARAVQEGGGRVVILPLGNEDELPPALQRVIAAVEKGKIVAETEVEHDR